jgi:hypothetical protein
MKQRLKIFAIGLLTAWISVCGQTTNERQKFGKRNAEYELNSALKDKTRHNVINSKTVIIKDSLTAISVAEPILFGIYGKLHITKQKPYEIYHIKSYWVLSGTFKGGLQSKGGTFLIIIDDRNSQIIKITHGK